MIYKSKFFVQFPRFFISFFEQGLESNREAMKNIYKALKNMLARTTKPSNKQIDGQWRQTLIYIGGALNDKFQILYIIAPVDEEDNHEYFLRLKKNLPKLQTSFPSSNGSLSSSQKIFKGRKIVSHLSRNPSTNY